jgi:chromate reductase, NAD(P)H dehydrogenase (quinone)
MILAISGSLRRSSINTAALRAAASAASWDGIDVVVDDSVRHLPPFDPDLEATPPKAVLRFRATCEAAEGLLLAVPEYAFGIPGAFKNALDWTVGSTALYRKPVALLDVAPPHRGERSRQALNRVLTALGADFSHHAVPVMASDLDPHGEIDDGTIVDQLRSVVVELAERVRLDDAA